MKKLLIICLTVVLLVAVALVCVSCGDSDDDSTPVAIGGNDADGGDSDDEGDGTAKKIVSLSINGEYKTEYVDGETFDTQGLIVMLIYDDGTSAVINNYRVDLSPLTEKTPHVKVYYGEGENEIHTTINVFVHHVHNLVKTAASPVTCMEDGNSEYYTCTKCGNMYEDSEGINYISSPPIIHSQGHDFGDFVSDNNATCTKNGTETKTCRRCGEKVTIEDWRQPAEHVYGEYVYNNDATCTEHGTESATCTRCGHVDSQTAWGTMLGHDYGDRHSDNNATCTADGTTSMICSHCGDKITESDYGSALGHQFTNYLSDNNATCTKNATETAHCDRDGCTATDSRAISNTALGHVFTAYSSDGNATCTADGTKTAHCDRDGCSGTHTIRDTGTKLNHTYDKEVVSPSYRATAATCATKATYYKSCTCGACGTETFEYGDYDPDVHDFTVTRVEPTCQADGSITKSCKHCSHEEVETLLKVDHNYGDWVIDIEPTDTHIGERSKHCSYCDGKKDITEIPMLPYTDGLVYKLNNAGTAYTVTGLGTASGSVNVTPVYLNKPVTAIAEAAFEDETSLTAIKIPTSVTYVGFGCLTGCTSLYSVSLPFVGSASSSNSYTNFGSIFGATSSSTNDEYVCSALRNVAILGGTSIAQGAFRGCSYINSLTLPFVGSCGTQTTASSSGLFGYIFGKSSFANTTKIQHSFSVTDNYFYVPNSISKVTILGGKVLTNAFRDCARITSITFGEGITTIGERACSGCTTLNTVSLPDGLKTLGDSAFSGCSALYRLDIPDSVDSIGVYLLNASGISTVELPEGIKTIPTGMFCKCTNLSSFSIPSTVTTIEGGAFEQCTTLSAVTFPSSVKSIGNAAYSNSALTALDVPSTVTSLGDRVFAYCKSLQTANIDCSCVIGDDLLWSCIKLTSLTFGSHVINTGDFTCDGCVSLKTVVFHAQTIGNHIFRSELVGSYIYSLESVTIGSEVKTIGAGTLSYRNFVEDKSLWQVIFEKKTGWYYNETSAISETNIDTPNKAALFSCQGSYSNTAFAWTNRD